MAALKPRPDLAQTLAAGAWAAVALTPAGWFFGVLAVAYSHLGDVTDAGMMTGGVVLFVTAPTSAFILAVYAARAGHRSGKIAVIVSGLLLLATIAVMLLYGRWLGLAVAAVVAVLVVAWVCSPRIAVVVSGLVLLGILAFSAWQSGGWISVAVIAALAVVVVLVLAWVRSRSKPPPGPGGARREEGTPAGCAARRIWTDFVSLPGRPRIVWAGRQGPGQRPGPEGARRARIRRTATGLSPGTKVISS